MPVVHFGEYIMELEKNMKLVILIDADNASADIIEPLLEEIAKYGVASVKRIYGDWQHQTPFCGAYRFHGHADFRIDRRVLCWRDQRNAHRNRLRFHNLLFFHCCSREATRPVQAAN